MGSFCLRYTVVAADTTDELNIKIPRDSSVTQYAEFLACLCYKGDPVEHVLVLCCYPLHVAGKVWKEINSKHTVIRHGEGTSERDLNKGDLAFVSLPEAIIPCTQDCDNEDIYLK